MTWQARFRRKKSSRNMDLTLLNEIIGRCRGNGFLVLGGFLPGPDDAVPEICPGTPARTLFLVGSTGSGIWPVFFESPEFTDGAPDPLDRFTRRVLSDVAQDCGLALVFPFDGPPYHPFQKWAMKTGGFSPSPLGVLAHDVYGPWSGFRAAFLSADVLEPLTENLSTGPCPDCADRPCLSACPVNAISGTEGYDVPRCRDHLASGQGERCFSGCLARRACPVGADFRPSPEQARFHMDSFMGLSKT